MALTDKLTNIANAIRAKTETTEPMTLDEMPTKIANIETKSEPNLQDKIIEITENGTQTITADEGYDGLKSIQLIINVTDEEEVTEYVSDGMVAWFDGYDEMDEKGHWNNRVGDDYIYTYYTSASQPIPHIDNGYVSNKNYCLVTTADYYKQDYTIEVVGKVSSMNNSDGSTGGWLLTMNETASWGIGVWDPDGQITFLNHAGYTTETEYTDYYGKIFTGALHISQFVARGSYGTSTNKSSVNGSKWIDVIETGSASGGTNGNNHPILSYYARGGSKYMIDGAIYCIRVYNRLLTNEELAYNHNLDKKRFNF